MENNNPTLQLNSWLDIVFNPSKNSELSKEEMKARFVRSLLPENSFCVKKDPKYRDAYLLLTDRYVFQARIWKRKPTWEEAEAEREYDELWAQWQEWEYADPDYTEVPPKPSRSLDSIKLPELRCGFSVNTCWDIRQNQTLEAVVESVYVRGGRYLSLVTDDYRNCKNRSQGMLKILEKLGELTKWRNAGKKSDKEAAVTPQQPHFFDVQLAITDAEKEFEGNQGISVEYESAELRDGTVEFRLKPLRDKAAAKALQTFPVMLFTDSREQEVFGKVVHWEEETGHLSVQLWTEAAQIPATGTLHKSVAFFYDGVSDVLQGNQEGTAYDFYVGQLPESLAKQCKEGLVLQFVKTDGLRQQATVEEYGRESGMLRLLLHGADKNLIPEKGVLRKTLNPAYKYQQLALKRICSEDAQNTALYALLMGQPLAPIEIKETYTPAAGVAMNESQRQAVEKAINTQELLLIQGPPGSGKTTIIVEMVRHFVKNGQRVLICSQSNHAVDNVLKKCLDLWYDEQKTQRVQCLRIGNSNKVEDALLGNLRRPLTQKIQDDMSQRSREAYQKQLQDSQQRKDNLAQKRIQLLALVDLILWLENTDEVLQNTKQQLRNSVLASFFGGKEYYIFEIKLRDLLKQRKELHKPMGDLLTATDADPQPMIPKIAQLLNNLFACVNWVEDVQKNHPYRSKLYLKPDMLHDLRQRITAQQQWLGQQLALLQQYRGNPMIIPLTLKLDRDHLYGEQLVQYRQRLDDYIRTIDSTNVQISKVLQQWQEVLSSDNKAIGEAMLKSVRIVGGTCIGTSTKAEFNEMTYDVVIVDEAGQIAMHDLLVPLVKGKKMILIGDQVQLPPMDNNDFARYYTAKHFLKDRARILEEKQNDKSIAFFHPFSSVHEIFSKSLFEVLIRNPAYAKHRVALDTQYRMHADIASYISKDFYKGNYKSVRPDSDFATGLQCFPGHIYFADTCALPHKAEQQDANDSYFNPAEAGICAEYLAKILQEAENDPAIAKAISNKRGNPDIGVITAYGGQIPVIRRALENALAQCFAPDKAQYLSSCIAINTLDSFQGMENKVILYSFVRSNRTQTEEGKPQYSIGFMNDVRRLNVLMTRAQSLLIMVGDSETLTGTTARTKHDKTPAAGYYGRLIEHCKAKNGYLRIEEG